MRKHAMWATQLLFTNLGDGACHGYEPDLRTEPNRCVQLLVYSPLVIGVDILIINFGYIVALFLCGGQLSAGRDAVGAFLRCSPLLSVTTVVALYLTDLYRNWVRRSVAHLMYSVVIGASIGLIATMALGLWVAPVAIFGTTLLVAYPIQAALISGYRLMVQTVYKRSCGVRHVIAVGESEEWACKVAEKFIEHLDGWYKIDKCVALEHLQPPYVDVMNANAIILPADLRDKDDLLQHCLQQGKEVLVVPSLFELTLCGAEPWEIDDLLVLKICPHRLNLAQEALKRAMDLFAGVALLLLSWPVFLFAVVAIPLTSRGPTFFRQKRVGKGGKLFGILKFRTMVSDAERVTGPVLAGECDPRVTRLGKFLRATRIDELPQLFNVIKGDMSLVGPRPERLFFVRQFEREVPSYGLRHLVKPGITGVAQVMGRYSTTAKRKLRFDLLYIYNYSLLLDLKILVQTIGVVLHREQAAGVPGTRGVRSDERVIKAAQESRPACAREVSKSSDLRTIQS